MQFKESPSRSLVKAISYRFLGTLVTVGVVFTQTREWALSLGAGLIDFASKIVLFYGHERFWDKLQWGRAPVTPAVIWFTGLSGAGKSTLSEKLRALLMEKGHDVELLDGDTVRTFFKDTGFSHDERMRHLKSMGFIASKLESHGTIVIASFITPYEEARSFIRTLCKNYIEIYVSTSLAECERRDTKGLYKMARGGKIQNFTGVSDPFESPTCADIDIETEGRSIEESFSTLVSALRARGIRL